jgi:hypothetical protein
VAEFVPFESSEQFEHAANALAEKASHRISSLRERFRTIDDVLSALMGREILGFWDQYDAGVCYGLMQRSDEARAMFAALARMDNEIEWVRLACANAQRLSKLVIDPPAFRDAIITKIGNARRLLKLNERVVVLDV